MRSKSLVLVLAMLMITVMAMPAFAARKAPRKGANPLLDRAMQYSFADETNFIPGTGDKDGSRTVALGATTPSVSPGVIVGDTWYDYQRNGSMRRMIDWGVNGSPDTAVVHLTWMHLPAAVFSARSYAYNAYNSRTASFLTGGFQLVQASDNYAGYVSTLSDRLGS